MMCHATQMLLDDTFCRSDDPSSNASLASEKTFGKKVVGRKRNQQQHISSAHDCRLGALLWHQMVDRRSTWGKSDSFCQPADLGWPKTISPLRMTTILIVSYTQTQPSHHGVAVKTGLVWDENQPSWQADASRQGKDKACLCHTCKHIESIRTRSSKLSSGHLSSLYSFIWPFCGILKIRLHLAKAKQQDNTKSWNSHWVKNELGGLAAAKLRFAKHSHWFAINDW